MPPDRKKSFLSIISVVLGPNIKAEVVSDPSPRLVLTSISEQSEGNADALLVQFANDIKQAAQ